jgi:uncharacterized protein (TIGR02145 family)
MEYRKQLLSFLVLWLLVMALGAQTVNDFDGNVYNPVKIGNQTWLAENLRTTRFNNGDSIPTITGAVNNDSTAIFQWAYANDTALVADYGRLYTWFAATDLRGVCPVGWRLPTDAERDTLVAYAGGEATAGNVLKDTGTVHWLSSTALVTNVTGFSARGSGLRGNPQGFRNLRQTATFWTSTSVGNDSFLRGKTLTITENPLVLKSVAVANVGACVRCIQQNSIGLQSSALQKRVEVYPNPSHGTLKINTKDFDSYTLSIYTAASVKVYSENVYGMSQVTLHLNQPAGLYFLVIEGADNHFVKKIILN